MSIKSLLIAVLTISLAAWSAAVVADDTETGISEDSVEPIAQSTVMVPRVVELRPLQSILDERRDRLQRKRQERFDLYSGRRFHTAPWNLAWDDAMDRHHDEMRNFHRRQRDAMRLYHDRMRIPANPWAEYLRTQSEIRSYNRQMAHLDHLEAMETHRYHRPYGFFW